MTKKEIQKLKADGDAAMADPEHSAIFIFSPERYYLGMWFAGFKNGDVTMQVFRKLDEPTTWSILYRYRHYVTEGIWDGQDQKQWGGGKSKGKSESEIEEIVKEFVGMAAKASGLEVELQPFMIRGNGDKAIELIMANPPEWMHMKKVEFEK